MAILSLSSQQVHSVARALSKIQKWMQAFESAAALWHAWPYITAPTPIVDKYFNSWLQVRSLTVAQRVSKVFQKWRGSIVYQLNQQSQQTPWLWRIDLPVSRGAKRFQLHRRNYETVTLSCEKVPYISLRRTVAYLWCTKICGSPIATPFSSSGWLPIEK